jgi:hypothetical protein
MPNIKNYASLYATGYKDEIQNKLNPSSWKDPDAATALYRLVKIECDAVPAHVGEPIDVVIIEKGRITWVNNPNKCSL